MKNILLFSGSNSSTSINQKLIEQVGEMVEELGANPIVISLRDYPAPIFGVDLEREEGIPAKIKELNKLFDRADAFIVSTPEHNGSIPAVFKNTLDWISRMEKNIFRNKQALFLSASPGARGGRSALEHLVTIMPYRGAKIIDSYSIPHFKEAMTENGLSETHYRAIVEKVQQLLRALN